MPVFGLADLRIFFGMGVPVSFQGVATDADGLPIKGLFDRPLGMKLGDQSFGGVDLATPEVRLPLNAFTPMPRNKDTLTVDGTDYIVTDTAAEEDGAILCYGLRLP